MRNAHSLTAVIVALLLSVSSAVEASVSTTYVEDFTTLDRCDTLQTTALWDTSAGELRFPPFEVTQVGQLPSLVNPYDIQVWGDYAYVADYSNGLAVVDVSDPSSPSLEAVVPTSDYAVGVMAQGDRAYVAAYEAGLRVVDITDPTSPFEVSHCDTIGRVYDVVVDGGYAYLAGGTDGGLLVVDVTGPVPVLAGSFDTYGDARGVAVQGDHAYVACYTAGLVVVNISDPTDPYMEAYTYTSGYANGVCVAGDYAYIAATWGGTDVVDVSDPADPVVVGNYDGTGSPQNVFVDGPHLYVAESSALLVLDVSDPTDPTVEHRYSTPSSSQAVVVDGLTAYVLNTSTGLEVLSVGAWTEPIKGQTILLGDEYVYELTNQGRHAYAAGVYQGLHIIDLDGPDGGEVVGLYTGSFKGCDVAGDLAVLVGGGMLHTIDVSDPTAPAPLGSCSGWSGEVGIAISGDHAYVGTLNDGLLAVDISNPLAPAVVDSHDASGMHIEHIEVSGGLLVTAAGEAVQVYDVSTPGVLALLGQCATPGYAYKVALSGDHAFVADQSWFTVVDVSDPLNPAVVGSLDVDYATDVEVLGDHAYLRHGYFASEPSLIVVDISDPTEPILIEEALENQGAIGEFEVVGDVLYARTSYGIALIKISDRQVVGTLDQAYSLDVEQAGYDVLAFRLRADFTGNWVRRHITSDGGATWWSPWFDDWYEFPVAGHDVRWKIDFDLTTEYDRPVVTEVAIDWRYAFGVIDDVSDIGNDQGGHVNVRWVASGHEMILGQPRIVEYEVYRRVEPARRDGRAMKDPAVARPGVSVDGHRDPPGDWTLVHTVPASVEDSYAIVAPTMVDSTGTGGTRYSVFFVRALCDSPGVYFDSPPDSGYSVDNLVPHVPTGLRVDYGPDRNELAWDVPVDPDFAYFRVYRGDEPGFATTPETMVASLTSCGWADETAGGWGYHYLVTAVDASGNESEPAAPEETTGLGDIDVPASFALGHAMPNPFNPATTIQYSVPDGGGRVRIAVYDVAGRTVRALVDRDAGPGRHSVVWDGRDGSGRTVASGVYYIAMTAPGYESESTVTLLK